MDCQKTNILLNTMELLYISMVLLVNKTLQEFLRHFLLLLKKCETFCHDIAKSILLLVFIYCFLFNNCNGTQMLKNKTFYIFLNSLYIYTKLQKRFFYYLDVILYNDCWCSWLSKFVWWFGQTVIFFAPPPTSKWILHRSQ